MNENERKRLGGAGGAFLACGIAFFTLGITGRTAFLGVGAAFFALGVAFLAKARQNGSQ